MSTWNSTAHHTSWVDRIGTRRVPFLSAMSMLGARDNELHSYMEIMDALRIHGSNASADAQNLWRRLIFNILISNTDDHLRNHGFLCDGQNGWSLSPAYDMNPVPLEISPRILSTAIDLLDNAEASLELALSVAPYFEIDTQSAMGIANEVAVATSNWRHKAEKMGIERSEIQRMTSAFEHHDVKQALSFRAEESIDTE